MEFELTIAGAFSLAILISQVCTIAAQVDTTQITVQNIIVNEHNIVRSNVTPPATNMRRMEWYSSVASEAQDWANTCQYQHNRPSTNQFSSCGQNIAAFSGSANPTSWPTVINLWASEKEDYTFGDDWPAEGEPEIGHYTQMIWATSYLVGCGFKECNGSTSPFSSKKTWRFYVCDYCPAGNIIGVDGHLQNPYRNGSTSCGNCPAGWGACINKLCSKQQTTRPVVTVARPLDANPGEHILIQPLRFFQNPNVSTSTPAPTPDEGLLNAVDTTAGDVQNNIIDKHNIIRSNVYPVATNMQKAEWYQAASDNAQTWADGCSFGHQTFTAGDMPQCGQSMAATWRSILNWDQVIDVWAEEKKNYNFGQTNWPSGSQPAIGHYVQLIWHDSSSIGCAYKRCPASTSPFKNNQPWNYYVCDYCPTGNYVDDQKLALPYQNGTTFDACSNCPSDWSGGCDSRLCTRSQTGVVCECKYLIGEAMPVFG